MAELQGRAAQLAGMLGDSTCATAAQSLKPTPTSHQQKKQRNSVSSMSSSIKLCLVLTIYRNLPALLSLRRKIAQDSEPKSTCIELQPQFSPNLRQIRIHLRNDNGRQLTMKVRYYFSQKFVVEDMKIYNTVDAKMNDNVAMLA